MHILHGTWLQEQQKFALWGENTSVDTRYRKGRRGAIAPHPFTLAQKAWQPYLDQFTTEARPARSSITLWLPGTGKKVQPSPQAQASGMEALDGPLVFLAWEVSATLLSATDALDFFLQLPDEGGRGFRLGHDLHFWQQAALLAANSLVEGRFLPTLSQRGAQTHAAWEARPDPALVQQMAAAMPPLCRAATGNLAEPAPPLLLLKSFLSTTIDTFIRDAYQHRSRPRTPWMQALTARSTVVKQSREANRKLLDAWEQWHAVDGSGGPFRVCFRLSDPEQEGDPWRIDYLLQASDDPSLLVAAERVWEARAAHLDYLEHRFHRPREKLLAALGLAARMVKPIERSLRDARPTGVDLSREEAYYFLTEALPLLETSGFAVLVPNWWQRRARLRARAKLTMPDGHEGTYLTRDSLLQYKWRLSLGEEAISEEEFEQLVALKQPLVRHKGEWIALDPDQIDAIKAFFERAREGEMTFEEALKVHAQPTELDGIEVDSAEVDGWLEELFERLYNPETIDPPPQPEPLRATLRPYQQRGFGWLAQMRQMRLGACLADDMGLGKTIQTISLWLHERETRGVESPALLVCPTSVVGNWQHELHRFAPSLRVMVHRGADRLRDEEFLQAAQAVDVVLTSYALLRRDAPFFEQVAWSDMVLDEAQNIKNPSTQQTHAARRVPAEFKVALTGTPVENRLTELWSIFQFLNPGYLGSQRAFNSTFSTPIERYGDEEATHALRQLTAPFILRRMKTDPAIIQDLPDKFENKVYCALTAEQATLYEAAVRDAMEAIESADEDIRRRGHILRMLTQLKQICNHPAHFLKEGTSAPLNGRSVKLDRLTEMIEEIRENDERLLLFTQYAEMGELLLAHLSAHLDEEVLFLHGGTQAKTRDEMVRRFQSPQGPPVFILSLKAGGTGLTLTAATHVFHFDRWYNPAVENQATDRAFRIGQTKEVQVHKFICLGTLEERIDEMIEQKQALAESIVGAGEQWISELSNDELRDLVMLHRDGLVEV